MNQRVFSFGASTAQGYRDDEKGGFIFRLGEKLAKDRLGHVENLGIGGHTSDQMVARAADVASNADASDIAIVTLGINDVARTPDRAPDKRVPLSRHRENVERLLNALLARCRVIYFTQYPVDHAKHGLDPELVKQYVDSGRAVASSLGIRVVDIHKIITDALYQQYIHEDGMHFNAAGHDFIAEELWPPLLELMGIDLTSD
ncbi:MAG: GDSL-type esterase/lipase family protein [Pseudomonadota bacterium]